MLKKFKFTLLALASSFMISSCAAPSGVAGGDKSFSVQQLEALTKVFYQELASNENITTPSRSKVKKPQCVTRAIGREVSGGFAALRSEWQIALLRTCQLNSAFLNNGILVLSNCTPDLLNDQDELAYVIAHSYAHFLLEDDNRRLSKLIGQEFKDKKLDFKTYLRVPENYDNVVKAFGLIDQNGEVTPYTEAEELAADTIAVQIMAKAGFNPSGMLILWNRLKTDDTLKDSPFGKMHPHSDDYLNKFSDQIKELGPIVNRARNELGRKPLCN